MIFQKWLEMDVNAVLKGDLKALKRGAMSGTGTGEPLWWRLDCPTLKDWEARNAILGHMTHRQDCICYFIRPL